MLSYKIFTFNPVAENTYILYNEAKEAIIIDPGCYFNEERQQLQQFLEINQLKPIQLINTHCHLDHVFGNKWVYETYQLELFIHPNEERVLQFAPESAKMWGMPFDNYTGPLHFLQASQVIHLGDSEIHILLVPGHSPGSICLYCKNEGFIIGGDVLFRDSIGRTDLPGGNHQQLIQNIREQLFKLPDNVKVLPGHGEPTTIGYEKINNPFLAE